MARERRNEHDNSDAAGTADGSFDLYYHRGWLHLVVEPPGEGGRPVYRDDVQNRVKLLGAPRADGTRIAEIIGQADGSAHRLVEWPDGERLSSVMTVQVSEDRLDASVHITEPKRGALPPTIEDVTEALAAVGVTLGVDRDAVSAALAARRYIEPIVAARGIPPVHARPGEIVYHFSTNRGKPYLAMEYGRINLKELNFIENKAAGARLAELTPAVTAKDGRAVTGETLPAQKEVEPVELRAGANTEITDGGTAIHATEDGNVRLIDGEVIVEPLVVVENVNYETGNIDFDGSVVVEKSIADGFVVKAGGDVQVERGVGRATITAGGNVLLKSGINGGEEGRISCGGNLVAKYVEASEVVCEGSVFVEEAIMHSSLSAVNHCILTGRRAEIIASEIVVGGSLWCRKLGSVAESPASVSIGIPPYVLTSYRQARQELQDATERREQLTEQLGQINRSLESGKDDPRLLQAKEQLEAESAELDATIKELKNNVRQLKDRLEASRKSMLVAEDTIYAGSVVTFGRSEYRPPARGAHATILTHRLGEIKESGYNPNDRPEIEFEPASEDDDPDDPPASPA